MEYMEDMEDMEDMKDKEDQISEFLAKQITKGNWERVVEAFYQFPEAHMALLDGCEGGCYEGTTLHVAVDMNEEGVVQVLVEAILKTHPGSYKVRALEMGNKRRDTPLHVASSRGFTKMCQTIIGIKKERLYLMNLKNNVGETPLFQAVANGRRHAFAYLSHTCSHSAASQDLVRNNGDTILHCAIRNEYFELAVIIVHYYESLSIFMNNDGERPLKVLATRPSAFFSSTYLSLWKLIQYLCVRVEPPQHAESKMEEILEEIWKSNDSMNYPPNYAVLITAFTPLFGKLPLKRQKRDPENPPNKEKISRSSFKEVLFPPNYGTILQFVNSVWACIWGILGGLNELRQTKKKHQLGGQLLKELMKRPDEAITGSGGVPTDLRIEADMYDVYNLYKHGIRGESLKGLVREEEEEEEEEENVTTAGNEKRIDKKETPFLAAARNGIVEMVFEIFSRNPTALRETNSQEENVLLVAVRNRKPPVVEILKRILNSEAWNTLSMAVDKDGKTMLHLAAEAPTEDMPSHVSYSTLQMIWDTNWFQYVTKFAPQHYHLLRDKYQNTPREIFKRTHENLRKESGEWLKETSESCSVVAALVAGASFATATTVPGGIDENGMPHLEGSPAFDAFVFASLFGLCFSLTGLIMFLTILTSRKLSRDYRRTLPLKLLLGLSSLFLSIIALLVSFCSGHSFLFSHKYGKVILPIYVATCFPVTFFALDQVPLYGDLLAAIFVRVPKTSDEEESL